MALKDTITNPKQKERYDRNFDSVETTFTQKELEEHDTEIRSKAIEEFAEKLKESMEKKHRHLIDVDRDGFEWLTTDAVETHIDETVKEMKGE